MFYTYILESLARPGTRYIGHSANLKQRLTEHNNGKCAATVDLRPWKVRFYAAFESQELADAFERYLKSGSGHAFSKRHF